jgi:hypothetical protein
MFPVSTAKTKFHTKALRKSANPLRGQIKVGAGCSISTAKACRNCLFYNELGDNHWIKR